MSEPKKVNELTLLANWYSLIQFSDTNADEYARWSKLFMEEGENHDESGHFYKNDIIPKVLENMKKGVMSHRLFALITAKKLSESNLSGDARELFDRLSEKANEDLETLRKFQNNSEG